MRVTYVPNPNAADGRGVSIPAANIYEYDGNPNGVIAATGPAILLGSGSSIGAVWVKTATDSGKTGWVQTDPPDVGSDIHSLPAAASALATNEFGIYDSTGTPHSKKVTGAQLQTLIHPANEIDLWSHTSLNAALEFAAYDPNSFPPGNFKVSYGDISAAVAAQIAANDAVKKNAFLEVSFQSGSLGTGAAFTTGGGFEQVQLSGLDGYALTDPGNNFDPTNNWYAVPVSGYYQIVVKFRLVDSANPGSSYAISAGLIPEDGPDMAWQQAATYRNGAIAVITNHYNAADKIMMLDYTDSGTDVNAGSMGIQLLSID